MALRPLLRRLLRHRRLGAGNRRAAHVAGLRLVVAADPVHGLAVVPHHEVMQLPFVGVDEFRLCGVLVEVAQQQATQMVRLPDGRLINPGLVASFYTHGYPQSYIDMMIAAEVKNA